jgi:PAS domain S-box-containing protein
VSRSKREWQETFDSITDVIFLSDLDFNITRINRVAEEMLGIPLLQLLGKKCYNLFHGATFAPESCLGHQVLKTGKVDNIEMYDSKLDLFLDMRVIPRRGKNSEVTGLIHVIRDTTEQKKLEEQFRHAQKMEALGQMAAGVAHEVRNPLHSLMSITEALRQELKENPEYDIYLSHINEQVKRLSSLMKDLLDFGKPVEPSNMNPESLTEICAAAIHLWKHSSQSVGHEVELIHPEDNGNIVIMADSQRLQQVFLNLLDNAAQHSPEGSAIRIIIDGPTGNMIKAYVVDRGSGIPEELLSRVFEPFFSTQRGGTGLGLSIIRNIVESHGGSLLIRNNVPLPGCAAELSLPILEVSG